MPANAKSLRRQGRLETEEFRDDVRVVFRGCIGGQNTFEERGRLVSRDSASITIRNERREILTIHVENLYYIGTVGEVPAVSVFKNGLANTPGENAMWIVTYNFASHHVPEQWYWQ